MQRDAALIVIDVRAVDEFNGELGHLRGARNIPLADLPDRIAGLTRFKAHDLAVICRTQVRSAKAAERVNDFETAGFGI